MGRAGGAGRSAPRPRCSAQRVDARRSATGITFSTIAAARVLDRRGRRRADRDHAGQSGSALEQEYRAGALRISPDGLEIAFAADVDAAGIAANFDMYPARRLRLQGGAQHHRRPTRPTTAPRYSPDGRWLAFAQQRIGLLRGSRAPDAARSRGRREREPVGDDWDRSADGLRLGAGLEALYGAIDDAGTRRVYRFEMRARRRRAPITGGFELRRPRGRDAGGDAASVAIRQSFVASRRRWCASTSQRRRPTQLSTLQRRAARRRSALGKVESVTYKGARRRRIQMWVIYPPGFDPSKKYPVFMLLHGGPHNGIRTPCSGAGTRRCSRAGATSSPGTTSTARAASARSSRTPSTRTAVTLPYQDTIKAADW